MHITITGRLGSGKSTVAKLLVEKHGYTYYSTGNIMRELAQKAKFSQHTISPEELAMFDGYFDRSIRHLRSRPWPLRLLYRLLFAAY